MSKQRELCCRRGSMSWGTHKQGHGVPHPCSIIYSETKPRLRFDNAARQRELGLVERAVAANGLAGRSQRYVSNGLVAEGTKIDLVEQIVEIGPDLQFCIFADHLRAGQPKGFRKRKVHRRIPGTAERIARDARHRRNAGRREGRRREIRRRTIREVAELLLESRVAVIGACAAQVSGRSDTAVSAVLEDQTAGIGVTDDLNIVERRPREAGVNVPDATERPTADHLLFPALPVLEDLWSPQSPQLEIVPGVVIRRTVSGLGVKWKRVKVEVG